MDENEIEEHKKESSTREWLGVALYLITFSIGPVLGGMIGNLLDEFAVGVLGGVLIGALMIVALGKAVLQVKSFDAFLGGLIGIGLMYFVVGLPIYLLAIGRWILVALACGIPWAILLGLILLAAYSEELRRILRPNKK